MVDKIKDNQAEQAATDNRIGDNEIIAFEKKRRGHLFCAVYFSFLVVAVLYGMLIYWICAFGKETSAWHTTLALTIAPTTILLFVLKLLAKSERNEDKQTLPATELLGQLMDMLAEKLKK